MRFSGLPLHPFRQKSHRSLAASSPHLRCEGRSPQETSMRISESCVLEGLWMNQARCTTAQPPAAALVTGSLQLAKSFR